MNEDLTPDAPLLYPVDDCRNAIPAQPGPSLGRVLLATLAGLPDAADRNRRNRAADKFGTLVPESIPLLSREGVRTRIRLSSAQVDMLIERRLIEQLGRRMLVAVRPRQGISISTVQAALRLGLRQSLPIAEDNRTIKRVSVDGAAPYFTLHRRHLCGWGLSLEPGIAE